MDSSTRALFERWSNRKLSTPPHRSVAAARETVDTKSIPRDVTRFPLSKYEIARVVGIRAVQLSSGMPPMVPIDMTTPATERTATAIARRELDAGVLPFHVVRRLIDGVEDVLDLEGHRPCTPGA